MRWPNRIGDAAWQGWVQERGLYFLGEKDAKYVDLVQLEDPFPFNKGPKRGRAGGGPGRQGPVDVPRPGTVAAAAGGHRGRVPAAREPPQRGQGPARGGAAPQVTGAFDVIVVGGGPAGSTAARGLARGGARVLVVDRAAFPRNKPCGGGLTWRALKRFPDVEAILPRIVHARRQAPLHGSAGRRVGAGRDTRAGGAARPAPRVRSRADDARERGGRGAGRGRRHHARRGDRVGRAARIARRPRVPRADRGGRRRRLQHRRQAPRLQSRLAPRPRRHRHDGGDAGVAPPRRRRGHAVGVVRARVGARVRLHLSEARLRECRRRLHRVVVQGIDPRRAARAARGLRGRAHGARPARGRSRSSRVSPPTRCLSAARSARPPAGASMSPAMPAGS